MTSSASITATCLGLFGLFGCNTPTEVLALRCDVYVDQIQPQPAAAGESVQLTGGPFTSVYDSAVYVGEQLSLKVYAHTGPYALVTFWVWVTLDVNKVEYHSFTQSSYHQTATMSREGANQQELRWMAVGFHMT